MRFDLSSLGVMSLAVASALSAAWWLDQSAPARAADAVSRIPSTATPSGHARLVKGTDGHYWAEAAVSGTGSGRAVRMMVDTGASLVMLTTDDARRLGVLPEPSAFTVNVTTASGSVRAAPVLLSRVSVAGLAMDDVRAMVVEDGLPHSLLGMSYLGRLSAFMATPDGLTLRA